MPSAPRLTVRFRPVIPTQIDDFNFSLGLDSETPDLLMKPGRLPYVRNARALAADDIESRVPISTRMGSSFYSVPVGETINAVQTATTGAATHPVGVITWLAAKFTASATGRLTRVSLNLKTTTPTGTGPVIAEVRADASGLPDTTALGQTSVEGSDIESSAAYMDTHLVEAPQVVDGTSYWIVAYIQDDGSNSYLWTSTTAATTSLSSVNSGATWTATSYALNFKTYISTDSPALGLLRAYRSTGAPVSLMAHGTNLYSINDLTGATTSIKSGLSGSATDYYFEQANDKVFYVNGTDAPRQWDFTTDSVAAGSPPVSKLIILHKNRLFYVSINDTRVVFTDAADFTTIQAVSFLYIPAPHSTDPIKSVFISQDNLVFATRETKYVLAGSDLASFTLRHAVGTVGTVSHNTVAEYQGRQYFLSDDGVYMFNGSFDKKISERDDTSGVTRIINSIADRSKCVATVWNGQYRLYYPESGSAVNDRCLIYDINRDSWWLDTSVYVGRTSIWSRDPDDNQLLEASSLVGSANYAETQFSDLGRRIDFEVRLPYNAYGNPAATKHTTKYRPQFRAVSGSYTVDCQVDKDYADTPSSNIVGLQGGGAIWGGGAKWGDGSLWGTTALIKPKIDIPGNYTYLQKRFKRYGVDNPVQVLGFVELFFTNVVK